MSVVKGFKKRPRKCLLYGTQGIGKTTAVKDCLVVDIEQGSGDLECARFEPSPTTYEEFKACLLWLINNPTEQVSHAFDSASWIDKLIVKEVCRVNNVQGLADIEYGKGGGMCVPYWEHVLSGFDALIARQSKNVILLAHSKIVKFTPPGKDSYQRYEPDFLPEVAAIVNRWVDDTLFYRWRTVTRAEELGFGKERTVALDVQERYLQTVEMPSAIAKNRLSLPTEIASFDEYKRHLPGHVLVS